MQKNNSFKKDIRVFGNVRALCTAALLAALCVVISLICKSFTITMSVRVTFENLPLILSGYILGPWVGLLTGIAADLASTSVTFGFGNINPILTLGCSLVGFTSGFVSHYIIPGRSPFKVAATVYLSHIIGNIIVKTVGLCVYYATPPVEIMVRILLYLGIAAVETVILIILLKSKGITKAIGALKL